MTQQIAMRTCRLAAGAVFVCATSAVGQVTPRVSDREFESRVDRIFARYDSTTTPGCAVAVLRDGRVVLKKAFGMANIGLKVPMTPATSTWIPYSEARVFVALAVAMLAADSAISLDDPVRRYVLEVPAYARDVRIRQLLHHNSGLADYGTLAGPGWSLHDPLSEDEFFRILTRWGRLEFEPGSAAMYSNSDYALLKVLVERVSGTSLHSFLHKRVFGPLDMQSTRIGADQGAVFPRHALFHEFAAGSYRALLRYRVSPVGGISVTTSADDLVRWEQALHDPARGFSALLETLERGSPDDGQFSFGIYHSVRDGRRLESHRGVGDYKYLTRAPEAGVSVATICNAYAGMDEFGPAVVALFTADSHAVRAVPNVAAPQSPSVTLTPAQLQQYVGVFRPLRGEQPTIRVAITKDQLEVIAPDGATYKARPLGNNAFEVVIPNATLRLVFAGADTAMTLTTLNAATGEAEAPLLHRWVPAQPTARALTSYPGTYIGENVDITLYITTDKDRVIIAGRGLPATALTPTREMDHFQLSGFSSNYGLAFLRDDGGRVIGISLDAARVRGMHFLRADKR